MKNQFAAPWSLDRGQIRDCEGNSLASVPIYPDGIGGPDDLANARLIAAAPEMLAALQGLVDAIDAIQLQYRESDKGEGIDIDWEIGPSKMVAAREALARTWEL